MKWLTVFRGLFLTPLLYSWAIAQADPDSGSLFLRRDIMYNRTSITLGDGRTCSGLYAGLAGDVVRLLSGGDPIVVPLSEIRKFEITADPDPASAALIGTIIGAYFGTIAVGNDDHETAGYLEPNSGDFPTTLLFAFPGLGLLGLIGQNFPSSGETFLIEGSEREIAEGSAGLREFLLGAPRSRRVHLTVQGGWLSPRAAQKPQGFAPSPQELFYSSFWGYGYYSPVVQVPDVNLLRKIQLTLSLRPWLEAGIALIQLSEPGFGGYSMTGESDTSVSYMGYHEHLHVASYLIVGIVEPFWQIFPPAIKWKAGMGVGLADVSLDATTSRGSVTKEYYYSYAIHPGPGLVHGFTAWVPSLTLFTTVELYPYSILSIGLAADYTFCPGKRFPGVPEWGIESRPIGNTCVGFTFGLHF